MDWFIKKNATLPILKMQVVRDGRSDYIKFMNSLEYSVIHFSMIDMTTGIPKIFSAPCQIVSLILPEGAPTEYYIYYKFKKKDTDTPGRYLGQFIINNENGILIVPIREELYINVQESFITDEDPDISPTPTPPPTATPTPTVTPTETLPPCNQFYAQKKSTFARLGIISWVDCQGIPKTQQLFSPPTDPNEKNNITFCARVGSLTYQPTQILVIDQGECIFPTPTPTSTQTNTPTVTNSNTITPTPTITNSNTPTVTQTNTPTITQTNTQTNTPTKTVTPTTTSTPTQTPPPVFSRDMILTGQFIPSSIISRESTKCSINITNKNWINGSGPQDILFSGSFTVKLTWSIEYLRDLNTPPTGTWASFFNWTFQPVGSLGYPNGGWFGINNQNINQQSGIIEFTTERRSTVVPGIYIGCVVEIDFILPYFDTTPSDNTIQPIITLL